MGAGLLHAVLYRHDGERLCYQIVIIIINIIIIIIVVVIIISIRKIIIIIISIRIIKLTFLR